MQLFNKRQTEKRAMDIEYEGSVDYSVNEIFDLMSEDEKEDMYALLLEDFGKEAMKESEAFTDMTPGDQKRWLCD